MWLPVKESPTRSLRVRPYECALSARMRATATCVSDGRCRCCKDRFDAVAQGGHRSGAGKEVVVDVNEKSAQRGRDPSPSDIADSPFSYDIGSPHLRPARQAVVMRRRVDCRYANA